MYSWIVCHIFLITFCICILGHQYASIDELKEMNVVSQQEFGNLDLRKLKFLEFNGTRNLFIGFKNQIRKYSYNAVTGKIEMIKKSPLLNEVFKNMTPYPLTFRNNTGRIQLLYQQSSYLTSYDTCLSYFERCNVRRETMPSSRYNKTSKDTGSYPSNTRPEQSWIRFPADLELYNCYYNIYIRGLEKIRLDENKSVLWACGTFASFPKAFLLDPETLEVIKSNYSDTNVMSCARWPDETMVTAPVKNGTELYIGSGWGLYRPSQQNPDAPYNNSTMLYSDWKMLWNGLYWPTRMAMVLGRDVKFISRYYETKHYLYFFGHEVNPQFSYLNAITRQSYRSFMLRICKNDIGFNYTASDEYDEISKRRPFTKMAEYWVSNLDNYLKNDETAFSYTNKSWGDTHHFPTKHFTSAIKFPFGCYLKRFDGAQSLNYFWGEQNMVYFNRLADVQLSFNWTDETDYADLQRDSLTMEFSDLFSSSNYDGSWDRYPNLYQYNSMVGAFSSEGFSATHFHNGWKGGAGRTRPGGAICQFQLSEWKTDHLLKEREPPLPSKHIKFSEFQKELEWTWQNNWPKNWRQYSFIDESVKDDLFNKKPVTTLNILEEFYALYGTLQDNFYRKGWQWFEGMQPNGYFGVDFMSYPKLKEDALNYLKNATQCGRCRSESEIRNMSKIEFETLMNHSSTAWPTDWLAYFTKFYDAFFHMNPMAVAGDNASFYMEGVEFMKMVVLDRNFTKYKDGGISRPLLNLLLVSTEGDIYRVAMCDLVSFPIALTTCEIKNTDQPYVNFVTTGARHNVLYPAHGPKHDKRVRHGRVSSLLSKWHLTSAEEYREMPYRINPQAPIVRDAEYDEKSKKLLIMTNSKLLHINLSPSRICASYRTCIECASDPLCGWSTKGRYIGHGICKEFDKSETQVQIQDVLGRGETCYDKMRNTPSNIKNECNRILRSEHDESVILRCNASTLFRGRVFWRKSSGQEFHPEEVEYSENQDFTYGPDNSLIISSNKNHEEHFECIGIPHDGGNETTLANHVVLFQDSQASNLTEAVTTNSYCPCVKTLKERLPKNEEIKAIYEEQCKKK